MRPKRPYRRGAALAALAAAALFGLFALQRGAEAQAPEDAVAACVLRLAAKLADVDAGNGPSPFAWLLGQCQRNPALRAP